MRPFEPQLLFPLTQILTSWRFRSGIHESDVIEPEEVEIAQRVIATLADQSEKLGLQCSQASALRALALLEREAPTWGELSPVASEYDGRLQDELNAVMFLSLSLSESLAYRAPHSGWESVIVRYRKTIRDIEEATKCLSLNRGTATVFHLMRVMEVGLKAAAKTIGVSYAPSWESYLRQLKTLLDMDWSKKSSRLRRHEPYLREVYGLLSAVRVAWRNPTVHVRRDYTIEEAREVYEAARTFMRHLASKATRRRI